MLLRLSSVPCPLPGRSEYTVSYELVKEKGRWKIAGAQVQQ